MTTDTDIYELVLAPIKTQWKIYQGFGSGSFSLQIVASDRIIADTASFGLVKLDVPASPSPGDFFVVRRIDAANFLIINFNNSKFRGTNREDVYIAHLFVDIEFTFINSTIGWISVPEGIVIAT